MPGCLPCYLLKSFRYTFDIIGELFYGHAFGFVDEGKGQNDWIKSLDKMIPFVCLMGVGPRILRPFIGLGTMLLSTGEEIRKGVYVNVVMRQDLRRSY